MTTPRSAAIYARISKDLTGERQGVDRQLQDCRELAERLGWPVGDTYIDNDQSAFSGKVRPEYRRMLEDLRSGARDALIAWHSDRITRGKDLEELIDVCSAASAPVRTVLSGELDLNTATGRMHARVAGAFARGESERMGERMRRANLQRAEQGRPATKGLRCFGYERDGMTIIPAEAEVIRALAERFLAGEPLAALVRWLNETGIPTVRGHGRWYNAGVRKLLRYGRLSGQSEYHEQIVGPGQWPAIITPAQTAAIRRILDDPARKTERAPSRYLLTKLLTCGLCGKPLISHPRRDKPGYCCRKDAVGGCGRISINAEPLDEYIRDLVLAALDGPELAANLANRARPHHDADELADLIRADQERQLVLAEALADGDMDRDQFSVANRKLAQRLAERRAELAALSGHRDLARYIGNGQQLADRWHTMTLDQRRAVIHTAIATVIIRPATKRVPFDPARATPTWRV